MAIKNGTTDPDNLIGTSTFATQKRRDLIGSLVQFAIGEDLIFVYDSSMVGCSICLFFEELVYQHIFGEIHRRIIEIFKNLRSFFIRKHNKR